MAWTAVQRKAKGAVGASVSIGSGDGWAAPTAGNLLVFSANSDATVTLSGAGTVSNGPSVIDGNGTYVWYKVATGSETTITGTPSVSDDIVITACEYSGNSATPFDVQNTSSVVGSYGTTTTSASVTTTASGDLVIAFAVLHIAQTSTSPATSPTWTNSFTNVLTGDSGVADGTRVVTFVSELTAGAAGAYSTACSWTNNMQNRQELIIAFLAGAAAATPPILVMPPRR